MNLQVAERWFASRRIYDDVTLIWEPWSDALVRCNIWHVRGRDRDLLIDAGLGLASLREAAVTVFDKPLTAVATHYHFDHVGGLHEFEDRVIHRCEAHWLARDDNWGALRSSRFGEDTVRAFRAAGYAMPELLLDALPQEGYDLDGYTVPAAPATRTVEEGDVLDIGDRVFEVLHLPGHSPGSIGLWEAATGTLFSGDAVYDGPLIAANEDSDLGAYVRTMERLKQLPVRIVHGGHDSSFGALRLREICDRYLALWR